jgi:putative PIN family toxin of toxin-antitoxin system
MNITLDTNVLISATFWKGDPYRILSLVEKRNINLIISKEIIEEYIQVLDYDEIKNKIRDKNLEMFYSIQQIVKLSTLVEPKIKLDIVKDNLSDNKILECAIAGKAKYIITNDQHLLKFKKYNNIQIITPKEFLEKHIKYT